MVVWDPGRTAAKGVSTPTTDAAGLVQSVFDIRPAGIERGRCTAKRTARIELVHLVKELSCCPQVQLDSCRC